MTATCHPIPQTAAKEMLLGVIHAICDRPGETAGQRDFRSRDIERSVMAFEPRDPVEIMLAGMAVGHYHLILDSLHDALGATAGAAPGRVNSGIAGLDRAMSGFLKELRIAQTRPLEEAVDTSQRKTEVRPPPASNNKPVAEPRRAVPDGLLPPLRTTETSIAAMMPVISPPTQPFRLNAGTKQTGAEVRPVSRPARHASPVTAIGQNALPGVEQIMQYLRTGAEHATAARPKA